MPDGLSEQVFDLQYLGRLTDGEWLDLVLLAGLLRCALRYVGKTARDAKPTMGGHFGALLAVNDARKPTRKKLLALAGNVGIPGPVMEQIIDACPAAIETESEEGT